MTLTYSLPDTLLINGTDLKSLPGVVLADLSGLLAPGRRRGEDLRIPGRNGVIGVADLPYAEYSFDVQIRVLPHNVDGSIPDGVQARRAKMLANLSAVAVLLSPGLVTLTRRVSDGASSYAEHTAAGRFVDGLQAALYNPVTGRTVLQFINLDGCWRDSSDAIVVP